MAGAAVDLIQIPRVAARWRRGEIGAAVCAALYFLHWQIARHGRGFATRKRKRDTPPDPAAWIAMIEATDAAALAVRLAGCLENHQFRGVSAGVAAALSHWLHGRWPLELHEAVPSPDTLLRMQARGVRAVTAITAYPRMLAPVLDRPDGYAFFLHDLEHAFKFFASPLLHADQRAFFASVAAALDRGEFAPYLHDPAFARKFDYLISDMNTHPQHSRQYLRAILIESRLRREGKAPAGALSSSARRAVERLVRAVMPPGANGSGPVSSVAEGLAR
jgi:hypothetical protein